MTNIRQYCSVNLVLPILWLWRLSTEIQRSQSLYATLRPLVVGSRLFKSSFTTLSIQNYSDCWFSKWKLKTKWKHKMNRWNSHEIHSRIPLGVREKWEIKKKLFHFLYLQFSVVFVGFLLPPHHITYIIIKLLVGDMKRRDRGRRQTTKNTQTFRNGELSSKADET